MYSSRSSIGSLAKSRLAAAGLARRRLPPSYNLEWSWLRSRPRRRGRFGTAARIRPQPTCPTRFSTIDAAVAAIGRGEVVIVVDAEDRENEGDFICAAEKATPAIVNFMITHGRGQVCMPILPDVAERLELPLMVRDQHDARWAPPSPCRSTTAPPAPGSPPPSGPTTIAAIVDPDEQAGRLRAARATCSRWWPRRGACCGGPATPRPPSIWPGWPGCSRPACSARSSTRRAIGPTARRSSPWPSSTACEIISIEELIRYRRRSEKLVERMAEAELPTQVRPVPGHRLRREVREPAADRAS